MFTKDSIYYKIDISKLNFSNSNKTDSTLLLLISKSNDIDLSFVSYSLTGQNKDIYINKKNINIILPCKIDSFYLYKIYGNNFIKKENIKAISELIIAKKCDTLIVEYNVDSCKDYPIFNNLVVSKTKLLTKMPPTRPRFSDSGDEDVK